MSDQRNRLAEFLCGVCLISAIVSVSLIWYFVVKAYMGDRWDLPNHQVAVSATEVVIIVSSLIAQLLGSIFLGWYLWLKLAKHYMSRNEAAIALLNTAGAVPGTAFRQQLKAFIEKVYKIDLGLNP